MRQTATGDRVDGRSVGELLMHADGTARTLLWDPDPDSAPAKARSWGEVVEAAAQVWSAIPDRTQDPSMARIQQLATALHRTWARARWPGVGDPDVDLDQVRGDLSRAAELIESRRHPSAPLSSAGQLDAEAARTRLMHTIYVSTHGVSAAVHSHVRDLQREVDAGHRLKVGTSLEHARHSGDRLSVVEHLAGSYLQTRWPTALAGEFRDPVNVGHLDQALARWDVQAHRTLVASSDLSNIDYAARVQQDLTIGTTMILDAAASRGFIDADQYAQRLRPALDRLERSWGRLGQDLAHLTTRQTRVDPELRQAGREVLAALRELTHDGAGATLPSAMAARTDLTATTARLQRNVSATSSLSHVVRDGLAEPGLAAPARGLHALAQANGLGHGRAASVDAADLQNNRAVPLPEPIQQTLLARAEDVTASAVAADSAGAFTTWQPRRPPPETPIDGRRHEGRTTPVWGSEHPVRVANAKASDLRR